MEKPLIVILAAGAGTHFEPISCDKTLLQFLGRPYIAHLIESLTEAGFNRAIVATNKTNNNLISKLSSSKLRIKTKLQTAGLGMGYALLSLEKEIAGQPIVIMNAVDILDRSLFRAVLRKSQSAYAVIPGIKVGNYFPAGYLKVSEKKVIDIVEKPGQGREPSNLVNLVCHFFKAPADLFSELKGAPNKNDDQYELSLARLMKKHPFDYITYDSYWSKLKYSDMIIDVMNVFLKHRIKKSISNKAKIEKSVRIIGDVYIDHGAVIMDGAIIKGPTYIGKGVTVGNHTLIRSSMIEEKSVIGFGSEVVRSYIGPECDLHHNFIGDSVLEAKVNPSYGTCTANLRFDKETVKLKLLKENRETNKNKFGAVLAEGVFLGVGSTTLPGVTIGKYSKIYPGSIVHKALPAYSVVKTYTKQEVVTK